MTTAPVRIERENFAASVSRRLDDLDASQDFFVAYASQNGFGLSQSELSKIVNGVRTASAERVVQIEIALSELEELKSLFLPAPLGLRDADQIRDLVRACVHQPETAKQITDSMGVLAAGLAALG